jgi:hypothetical protein
MSETMGSGPEEMRQRLIERSIEDEGFRRRLLAAPKGTAEEELGIRLPDWLEVRTVEETPETVYLVLPPPASSGTSGGELSDKELESVSGGWGDESGGVTEQRSYECYQNPIK